jgi:hypothetical protein
MKKIHKKGAKRKRGTLLDSVTPSNRSLARWLN